MNQTISDPFADLPSARVSTGFLPLQVDTFPRVQLWSSCPPEDEIFGSLNFYCDVEDVGQQFVQKITGFEGTQRDDTYDLFQAFIRQGQTFFSSARHLEPRAGPLFYYYEFLNLAKAHVALRKPDLFSMPLKHGLAYRHDAQDNFSSHAVIIGERGVFPELYYVLTGERLPNLCSFRIVDLLGYVTDISHEYQAAGFGLPFILPVRSKLFVAQQSATTSQIWPVFAVGPRDKLAGRSYALERLLQK